MEKKRSLSKPQVSSEFSRIQQKDDINEEVMTITCRDSCDESTERRNESISVQCISHLRSVIEKKASEDEISEGAVALNQIFLKFSDNTILSYDLNTINECCPILSPFLLQHQRKQKKEFMVELPSWITPNNMIEYILYINDEEYLNFNCSVNKLLAIADYFNNQIVVTKILKGDIIPHLSTEDTLTYLEYSFNKLSSNNDNSSWMELFYESINSIAKNLPYFLEEHYSKLQEIKTEIIEEIIEKFLQIQHNGMMEKAVLLKSTSQKILELLYSARGTDNIFDLISLHENRLKSPEIVEETLSLKPNLKIKLTPEEKKLTYQEFPNFCLDKNSFCVSLYGNHQKDYLSLNYNVKFPQLHEHNLKSLSILTVIDVKNDAKRRKVKLKTFSSEKNQTKIFELEGGISYITEERNKLSLKVYIKVCYIYSFLQNYLLLNFSSFCFDNDLYRLNKNQLKNILVSKFVNCDTYLHVFLGLSNWLRDPKNHNGKLNILLESILWDKLPITSIVEFIVKYTKLIEKYGMMKILQDCIDSKVVVSYKNRKDLIGSDNDSSSLFKIVYNACRSVFYCNRSLDETINISDVYNKQPCSNNKRSENTLFYQEERIEPRFKVSSIRHEKYFPIICKKDSEPNSVAFNTLSGPMSKNCSVIPSSRKFDNKTKEKDFELVKKSDKQLSSQIKDEYMKKSSGGGTDSDQVSPNRSNKANSGKESSISNSTIIRNTIVSNKGDLTPQLSVALIKKNIIPNSAKPKGDYGVGNPKKKPQAKDDSLVKIKMELYNMVQNNYKNVLNRIMQPISSTSSLNTLKNNQSSENGSNKATIKQKILSKDRYSQDTKKSTISTTNNVNESTIK